MLALVHSSEYDAHETGDHPENKERLHHIMEPLEAEAVLNRTGRRSSDKDLHPKIDVYTPEMASYEAITRVHSRSYIASLKSFCDAGGGHFDQDTVVSKHSYKIAKLAAGGSIKAAKLVLNGYDYAYSIARPPGHHATRRNAMGFCLFNNVAVAIQELKNKTHLKKFLIFDIDVHFGNGTSEIYFADPDVLYISIHQDPRTLFPGSGFIDEIGEGEGEGFNINIPMPPGSDSPDYKLMVNEILKPVAGEFKPDMYFLELGFDAHREDPLSKIQLDDDFFPWIADKMMKITKKMVMILEGGYSPSVLSRCNMKMINVLNNNENYNEPMNEHEVGADTTQILSEIKDTFSSFYSL